MTTLLRDEVQADGKVPAARDERTPRRALAFGLLVIAVGLAVVAILGPLVTGAIDYRVTETLRNQTIGLDAVSLFGVAPLALAAALLALRGHVAGAALAVGIGSYTSYMFLQYVLGPEYLRFDGNNERLFPLCLVLFVAGGAVVIAAWGALRQARIEIPPSRARVVGWVVLPVLSLLAFGRYVPALADAMSRTPEETGYLAGPGFFWAIALLDLGVFLPLAAAACVGLATGAEWAARALITVAGWFALVGPAVAAMAVAMYANDDPNGSRGDVAFMSGLGLAFLLLAAWILTPVLRSGGARPTEARR